MTLTTTHDGVVVEQRGRWLRVVPPRPTTKDQQTMHPTYPVCLGYTIAGPHVRGWYVSNTGRRVRSLPANAQLFPTAAAAMAAHQAHPLRHAAVICEVILSRHGGRRCVQPPMDQGELVRRVELEVSHGE